MAPRIHLLRHGQGYHQLEPTSQNQYLPDPLLTDEGIAKCKDFAKNFPKSIRPNLICSSPLRRSIQTAQFCFAENLKQAPPIVLLPYAQEATDLPSDTGSDRAVLEQQFGELVDASMVEEGWNSNTGIYAPTAEALKERAGKLRAWLRARTEAEVVVVGHGNFWHHLTGEVDEEGNQTSKFLSMRRSIRCSCIDDEIFQPRTGQTPSGEATLLLTEMTDQRSCRRRLTRLQEGRRQTEA
jgi:broad specificity phosphatase PhoE